MLREYVIGEAMAALGIPTTRSLAVLTTGDPRQVGIRFGRGGDRRPVPRRTPPSSASTVTPPAVTLENPAR
jgi:hypothetical protein